MTLSKRMRAGVLLCAATFAAAVPAVASQANVIWIAGYFMEDDGVKDYGNYWMAVGAVGAGAGTAIAATGVGAAAGTALVGAGAITAGIGG